MDEKAAATCFRDSLPTYVRVWAISGHLVTLFFLISSLNRGFLQLLKIKTQMSSGFRGKLGIPRDEWPQRSENPSYASVPCPNLFSHVDTPKDNEEARGD
ncbi:hypothetical protein L596_005013 [Steinernema carpocapsae]|uniref:Uncharacterized protein n=1 Tax=Steinernema carpocapsae TaxID=34508 RepID=A0A4U8V174_STECR|nr:hypothetical protein L596_005013 [Steinernema carpocapsae]